ncbi:MAG: hypothetical protein J7K68_05970 [Candidatus Diapherotrites archaeon]|nr:hypothetical protein [Candidatus Diapherotrites archaeon]
MDPKDRKRIVDMKIRGEPDEKIIKIFRVLGYSRNEIKEEILNAEETIKNMPKKKKEEIPQRDIVIPMVKRRRFHTSLPMVILIICLVGIIISVVAWFGPTAWQALQDISKPTVKWGIAVRVISCSNNEVVLGIKNMEGTTLPESEFSVDGATCTPKVTIYPGWEKQIVCVGNFEKGKTYVVTSENTLPDGFKCT